jgi:hypothetical protein
VIAQELARYWPDGIPHEKVTEYASYNRQFEGMSVEAVSARVEDVLRGFGFDTTDSGAWVDVLG